MQARSLLLLLCVLAAALAASIPPASGGNVRGAIFFFAGLPAWFACCFCACVCLPNSTAMYHNLRGICFVLKLLLLLLLLFVLVVVVVVVVVRNVQMMLVQIALRCMAESAQRLRLR